MAFDPRDYTALTEKEVASLAGVTLKTPGGGLQVENCTGANCGDALANYLNSGPLNGTGLALPRGGIGPGDLARVGKSRGAAVYGKGDLSPETLTPGTVIHMTRQPGDRYYDIGTTHIGIVDTDAEGNKVFKSFTAGKGWRTERIDRKFIEQLPAQITATNPVSPGSGGKGWLETVGGWLGPAAAEAAEGPPSELVRPGFNPADYSVRPGFNPADYQPQAGASPQAGGGWPLNREEFMQAAQGADVAAGLYEPPKPGRREPGIYAEERTLLDSVKDYLGYRDLPAFLPVFNKETGMWEAKNVYEARKLFHSWDEPTEVERVMAQGVFGPLTLGVTDYLAKDKFGPVPAPETMAGAVAAGTLGFGSFMAQPFNLAEGLLGTRLAPTLTGLRGVAQLMAQGGATLGLATSLSSLLPSLAHNERLSEAGLEFVKSSSSGTLIGALFPLAGAIPTRTLRLAGGLAALDFVKTRFQAAPDQGYFTLDDVYRGVRNGSIDRTVLAQKTFDYLLDLYFLWKTPSMLKQLEGLKVGALKEEARRGNPQEAEEALVAIGKSGTLEQSYKYQEQGKEKAPVEKPDTSWRKPWELSGEEYVARVRALTAEDRPEPTAERIAKQREADVRQALKRGEPVPREVLADFPELAARYGRELQAAEPGSGRKEGAAKSEEGQDPYQKAIEQQREALKEVEAKIGRARTDKSKEKLLSQKSVIQEEIARLEKIVTEKPESAYGVGYSKRLATEDLPEYAQRSIHEASMGRRTNEGGSIDAPDPFAGGRWDKREVPLTEIMSNPRNKSEPDAYKGRKSVTEGPIVIDDRGEVIDGNHRVNKAMLRGDKVVSAYVFEPPKPKAAPEAPDYAYIEKADLITGSKTPEVGGYVLREAVSGEGKPGFVIDQEGRERFIPRDEARLMGMEDQERLLGRQPPSPQPSPEQSRGEGAKGEGLTKMYGGGPGVEEIQAYGRQLADLGKRMIDWVDVRLEKNLPEGLRDKDAGKVIGSLLLKFQMFEDIARTYPEAKPTFEAARAGLALKTRHAAEFYSLMTPYLSRLKPEERGRVDPVLAGLDLANQEGLGLEFRLGNDIDRWQSYLLNPREDIREKGIAFYMGYGRGLSRTEAEGAFGVRMALDYAKALHLDWHTRTFREWLESHGFDRGKVKDILDWVLNTEMKPEEIAKAYFGPEPGKNVAATLERFRQSMQYWLKETHQYIPHSRYGEYFIRVVDTNLAAKAKEAYRAKLKAIDARYPKDRVDLEATLQQSTLEFMGAAEEGPGTKAAEPPRRMSKADRLRAEAREAYQDAMKATVVHAEAAETRAQYHEKRARLEAGFPAEQGFLIKEALNKRLPMEIFAETHIPRVWRIVTEAADKGTMPQGSKEAMIEAWQDFLAAKGFGAHYIKRSNVSGYETDLTRPLTGYLSGLAGYIGKMEKIRGFSEALQKVPTEMPNLIRHLNEYANYQLSNPYEFEGVRNVIYNWTLGGNFSFHVINALQNVTTGWAVLGTARPRVIRQETAAGVVEMAEKGPVPMKQLAGSYKDWGRYMATGEGLRPGEEAVLQRARYEPELAPSGVGELSGQAYNPLYRWMHNDPTSLSARAMDVFKGFWSGAFVEQMNRETFFLAAWRTTGDFEQSIALTREAHFLYGKETRMSAARGLGSLPAIFMTYTANFFTLLKNFSKAVHGVNPEVYGSREMGAKGLARMFGGAMVTGGLTASFVGPIIKAAWAKVFGSNLEEDARDYFQEFFGVSRGTAQFIERALDRGLPAAALGIDIGSRIAPNLPLMNLPGNDLTWQNLVAGGLGAASIPFQAGFGVGKALNQGEPWRALEAGAPVSVRNLLQAIRLHTEGATTMKGQPIFTDQGEPLKLDMGETVRKGLGFQPVRLAEHYTKASHARKMERDRRDKVQDFAGDLARAIRAEDEAGFRRTIEAWTAYNNKMLTARRYADVIEPQAVEQAVKMRFQPKYPDASEKKMILREMGRQSLTETLSPEQGAVQ